MKIYPQQIEPEDVMNMLVTAFEGGCNYWLHQADPIKYTGELKKGLVWWGAESIYNDDLEIELLYDNPEPGPETTTKRLTYADLKKGFDVMALKHTRHFLDVVSGNFDADTADVWLQCALFGEIIYG